MTTKYGTFEGHPAVWDEREAFVVFNGDGWRKMNLGEVSGGAGLMSKDEFERTFPKVPKLPL